MKLTDRFVYQRYDRIVTISDAVDANLKRHLGKASIAISKIYNGINLEEIKEATPYNLSIFKLPEGSKILLQVSSFTPQKDQPTLIRALKHLPSKYHVFLVGDGPTRTRCETLSKELNLEKRVHFMGIRKDVPRLLKSVDFIILSSHYEGLSLSSVEGMASGKPFLASDVPGLKEVVSGAGILFPNGDDVILAECILRLESDSEFYYRTLKSCLSRAEEFNITGMVDAYLNLYSISKI